MSKISNTHNLNKIIEFRQVLYATGFQKEKDALFEILDALRISGSVPSFPHLSLQNIFHWKWSSLYKRLQREKLNTDWLTNFLAEQVLATRIQTYSLDSTAWVRPRAETLDENSALCAFQQQELLKDTYTLRKDDLLDWTPEANSSWSLSVAVNHVPFEKSALAIGVEQVQQLNEARQIFTDMIIIGDARYRNERFFEPLQGGHYGLVARMRKDRLLHFK